MNQRPLCIIINRLSVGGAERLAIDEFLELRRRGVEAHLATLYPEGRSSLMGELDTEVRFVHAPKGFWGLLQLMRTLRPQVVICHLWYANAVGRIAAKVAGVGTVLVFEHNVYDRVKSRLQFAVDWLLQGWATAVVAVSEAVRVSLIAHGIGPSRIAVVPNAVDVRRYSVASTADLRREFNLPKDAVILLAIGRLTRQKGFDMLVRAMPGLPAHFYTIVVGMGEEEHALQTLAQDLGVAHRVHFSGVRHDVPSVLKGARFLVMPSRWEGEPITALEALAVGTPIIGSDIPQIKKLVVEGVNGFLFPVENIEALTETVRRAETTQLSCITLPQDRTIEHHVDSLMKLVTQ